AGSNGPTGIPPLRRARLDGSGRRRWRVSGLRPGCRHRGVSRLPRVVGSGRLSDRTDGRRRARPHSGRGRGTRMAVGATLTPEAATEFATIPINGLRGRFRGALLRPGEEGYDEARRIWNGAIDRRPALIARCAGTDDVTEAVRFAQEHGLPISVR